MPVSNKESRYVLVVDNLSRNTRSKDIKKEMDYFGRVLEVERDTKTRCALVEFERSGDATAAWRKMDGFYFDGNKWKVEYAIRKDFDFFGWKWTEGGDSPSPVRSRSRSRSAGRSTPDRVQIHSDTE